MFDRSQDVLPGQAYIYTGKGSDDKGLTDKEKDKPVSVQALIRLCKVIEGSNCNVTADNWFTLLDGVKQLEKIKLTYVGIIILLWGNTRAVFGKQLSTCCLHIVWI